MVGEAKLEMYLEENPPIESNVSKACTSLKEAKSYLTELVSEQSIQVKYYCLHFIIFITCIKIISGRYEY